MGHKISIAVVDDHPLVAEGVIHVLANCPDMDVIGRGSTSMEAIDLVKAKKPDILVLDSSIPGGGMTALQTLMDFGTATKFLILTVSDDETDVFNALRIGAHGYVLKGIGSSELIQAVRSIYHDGHYLTPSLGAKMLTDIGRHQSSAKATKSAQLSLREDEVLSLIAAGHSNKSVGAALNLSEKTVKHYITSLFKKLNVKSRVELAILVQKKIQEGRQSSAE
jgi:two-component system, NarL family, nitrate/nitrite response regulator NarL